MAKIYLNIEADDAADLQNILWRLAGMSASSLEGTRINAIQQQDHPQNGYDSGNSAQAANQGAEERPTTTRRGRPPKDAQNAVAPSATPASATTASDDTQGQGASSQGRSLADQIAEVVAEEDGAPTREAVEAVVKAYFNVHGAMAAQEKLKEVSGAARISEIPVDKFAAVIAAFA